MAIIAIVLAANISFGGEVLTIPFVIFVLCRSTYQDRHKKLFKWGFVVLFLGVWGLTHIGNRLAYPLINETVMIDIARVDNLIPSTNRFQPDDDFVLLTALRDWKKQPLTENWVAFKVENIEVRHPEFGLSVEATLKPVKSNLNKTIDYILFSDFADEMTDKGILKMNQSHLLPFWIMTF